MSNGNYEGWSALGWLALVLALVSTAGVLLCLALGVWSWTR